MPFPPTPEQLAIIEAARGDDNLMIKALAGTGKTSTLELITPQLGADGKLPSNVLALAFNVKIRDELKSRLPAQLPHGAPLKVQTLNGLGQGAWWSFVRRDLQVDTRKSFQILKAITSHQGVRLDKEEFAQVNDLVAAAKAIGFVPKGSPLPGSPIYRDNDDGLEALFDWADINHRQDLEILFRAAMIQSIKEVLSNGLMDFNDQIYMPVVFSAPFPKFDTVLVDEAQDLSHMNHIMIERSCARRMIVVGDPNQAIYAFRGALSNSMDAMKAKRQFKELPLTVTFRCAKAIVAHNQGYVPEYKAAHLNPEGIVEDWRTDALGAGERSGWSASDIPPHCMIICRNNAPLISLAFKLILQGRGVRMLGNDIGRSLERALDQACKRLPPAATPFQVLAAINAHFSKEIEKAKTDRRKASLEDRWECLKAIANNSRDLAAARRTCHNLFENPDAIVTLSSGHKSKGLEEENVIHLDAFRIPSQYARSEEELRQEYNIEYVINTRAKTRLIFADLGDFQ